MKKIVQATGLFFLSVFATFSAHAQGLDSVIVERYYISNAADSAGSVGTLPVGSTTYRIYVDMKPGYKFLALFGTPKDTSLGYYHPMWLKSTTPFFNNEDRGALTPNGLSATNAKKNTNMLDSWFSAGAAASGQMGVLKTEDNNGSIGNTSTPPILQNNDPAAGIPICLAGTPAPEDGMIPGTPEAVSFVGLDNQTGNHALDVFDGLSMVADSFWTDNGSVTTFNGAVGPTVYNRVLVGQFTTLGDFCWHLNVELSNPSSLTENWVADLCCNEPGSVYTHPSLKGCLKGKMDTTTTKVREANAALPGFSVYPNPSTGGTLFMQINASVKGNTRYAIYDLVGKEMMSRNLGEISQGGRSERIDVSSLSDGMYMLRLTVDGKSSTRRIVKN